MIFQKFWWLLLICVGLSAIGVRLYTANLPPLYESKAKMWYRGKLNVLPEERAANDELASQVELLQSTVVQRKAFEELRRSRPDLNLVGTNGDRYAETPFKLTVKEVPKASVFDLRAVGSNPEPTQAFLDAVMTEFQKFKRDDLIKTTESAQKSVGTEILRLEKQIYDTEEKARRYQIDNKLLVFQEQGSGAASYLARISRQLAVLRMENDLIRQMDPQQVAELGEKMLDNTVTDMLPGQDNARELLQSLAGPEADSLKASQQLGLLKLKRDQLARYLRPAHPKMLRLEKSISDQEALLEIFRQQGQQQLRNREAAIKIQIKSLEDAYKEWETKAAESSVKLAEYDRIQKEVLRYQGFYDHLMTAVQTVDLSKKIEQESFGVLDPASVGKPVNRAAKAQLLGVVMGFFFGLGLLYLLEQFDDRFSSIAELRSQLAEQVVGQIPDLGGRRSKVPVPVLYANDTRHAFAESFMTLRSALQFTFAEDERPRTMVVTSSVPGEGKTTVASNLAITLALAGSRVLLIDADLRRSSVHKLLNLPHSPGMAEILSGKLPYTDTIQATSVNNLWFIPAGDTTSNPGALFLHGNTDKLIETVAPQYDFVILDSAPVMVTDDTASLAPKLDGVLFVVRGGFTSARLASEGLDMLRQRKVRVLGVILNRAVSLIGDYSYGYKYKGYQQSAKVPAATVGRR